MSPIKAAYRIVRPFGPEHRVAVVAITADRDQTEYYTVTKLPENDLGGAAYSVFRLGAERTYDVRVVAYRAADCECMQFYKKGYCRHGFIASVAHYGRAPHEQPRAEQ